MFKAVVGASLAAAATAMMPMGDIIPRFEIKNNDGFVYYTGKLSYNANVGYTTMYNANPNAQPDNSQSYQLNIFAWANLVYDHESFEAYWANYQFQFDLFNIVPYGQTFSWNRADAGHGFAGHGAGFRDVQLLNFWTNVKENAKTCSWSAFNGNMPTEPVCAYNDDKITEYKDPVWKFNTGQYIVDNYDTPLDWIVGGATYYNF